MAAMHIGMERLLRVSSSGIEYLSFMQVTESVSQTQRWKTVKHREKMVHFIAGCIKKYEKGATTTINKGVNRL